MFGKSALLGGVMMAAMACAAPAWAAAPVSSAQQGTIAARNDGIEVRRGDTVMRVTALTDDILRVRIARGGTFPEDASWAVLPGDARRRRDGDARRRRLRDRALSTCMSIRRRWR